MKRKKFEIDCKDLPIRNTCAGLSDEEKKSFGILTHNAYRESIIRGEGASIYDETYRKNLGVKGGHICCKSKVWWRHKATCKNAVRNAPDDMSDLKI